VESHVGGEGVGDDVVKV